MSTPTKPYVSDDQIRQMEAGKFMSDRPYEMNYEQGAKDMRELYEARTPTKADQVREALEELKRDIDNTGGIWEYSADNFKAKIDRALSLLADLDGGGEVVGVRPAVAWFAQQMEAALRRNDHKGGWGNCHDDFLWQRLGSEREELRH